MSAVPSKNPLPDALLRAENLPTMPGVAVEVLRLCRDDDATLDDLAAVLSHDAALSARLLKFSNSSLYNLGQEVSTLQRATLVLGLKTVQLMSLSFSLASSLPRENADNRFDYRGFWRRSMIRSVAARTLASMSGSFLVDEAFLCGLLKEIGQIVLAQCMTEDYEAVLIEGGDCWPTIELERKLLGFDHADVGAALLRSWEIPEQICAVLESLYAAESHDVADARTMTQILSIANEVTELLTEEKGGLALARIEDLMLEHFDIDEDATQIYLFALEDGIRETSEMLNVKMVADKTHEEIIEAARKQFVDTSFQSARELESVKSVSVIEHRLQILSNPELNDPLTGIPNQQAFDRFLAHEVAARLDGSLKRPLGILVAEIDRFPSIAATFGEQVSREVLRLVGATLASIIRKSDLVTRLQDGTFAIILGECTAFGIKTLAERLRAGIEERSFQSDDGDVSVTVSVGGACLGSVSARSDGQALLEVARRYTEKARSNGPNRCLVRSKPLHPGEHRRSA
jgi:diguanylate cyclase (GGDEF)-like protein